MFRVRDVVLMAGRHLRPIVSLFLASFTSPSGPDSADTLWRLGTESGAFGVGNLSTAGIRGVDGVVCNSLPSATSPPILFAVCCHLHGLLGSTHLVGNIIESL